MGGLTLTDQGRRGTLLSQVWEKLSDPKVVLRQVKRKASLTEDYWSESVRVWRYETGSFGDPETTRTGKQQTAESGGFLGRSAGVL